MKCPRCDGYDTKVIESRLSHEGHSVRRRRVCQQCNHRYTTYEKEEEITFQVKKKDSRFENFSRSKLIQAISAACTKRAVPIEKIELLVANIEHLLRKDGERVVGSNRIGDIVMKKLREIDHVAYVRFASIYKDFKDPEEFVREFKSLQDNHLNK